MRHPSFYTLIPIIGTMLIIWYANKDEMLTKLISTKLFVGVGLISYPLYLWHYPIFSFVLIHGGGVNKFLIGASIVLLSVITYFFIENLYRRKASKKFFLISLIISISLILSLNIYYLVSNNFLKKKKFLNFQLNQSYSWDNNIYYKKRNEYLNNFKIDRFSDFTNNKKILIIGNSHAEDFYIALKTNEVNFDNIEFGLYVTEIWCLKNFLKSERCQITKRLNNENKKIEKNLSNKNISLIKNSDTIILSSYWSNKDLEELEEIILMLKKLDKRIFLTSNSPVFQTDIFLGQEFTLIDYFTYKNKRLPDNNELIKIEKDYYRKQLEHIKKINSKLKHISNKLDIIYFEKEQYVCVESEKRCRLFTDKKEKIYYDGSHYTVSGAKYFGEIINKSNWFNNKLK